MVQKYNGHYQYAEAIVSGWNSTCIGVYYCGYLSGDALIPLYIGRGTGEEGIRGRLLDHLREDNWPGATHFGYRTCDTVSDAIKFEAEEIKRCTPKYNVQGV